MGILLGKKKKKFTDLPTLFWSSPLRQHNNLGEGGGGGALWLYAINPQWFITQSLYFVINWFSSKFLLNPISIDLYTVMCRRNAVTFVHCLHFYLCLISFGANFFFFFHHNVAYPIYLLHMGKSKHVSLLEWKKKSQWHNASEINHWICNHLFAWHIIIFF